MSELNRWILGGDFSKPQLCETEEVLVFNGSRFMPMFRKIQKFCPFCNLKFLYLTVLFLKIILILDVLDLVFLTHTNTYINKHTHPFKNFVSAWCLSTGFSHPQIQLFVGDLGDHSSCQDGCFWKKPTELKSSRHFWTFPLIESQFSDQID